MEIIAGDRKKKVEQKTQVQFHGFGEKSKSFTIKGMTVEEAFNRTVQIFKAICESEDGFIEVKAGVKNGHSQAPTETH